MYRPYAQQRTALPLGGDVRPYLFAPQQTGVPSGRERVCPPRRAVWVSATALSPSVSYAITTPRCWRNIS